MKKEIKSVQEIVSLETQKLNILLKEYDKEKERFKNLGNRLENLKQTTKHSPFVESSLDINIKIINDTVRVFRNTLTNSLQLKQLCKVRCVDIGSGVLCDESINYINKII